MGWMKVVGCIADTVLFVRAQVELQGRRGRRLSRRGLPPPAVAYSAGGRWLSGDLLLRARSSEFIVQY
ncbi:hypothetical protein B842_05185 [Corynebacterium humireducens NBRC 106098 = DSM 45392]|uniref:Uncharacterized protein n=1 Tax=Corynebacterium humireducens NBRC 106098 = DSM 45392 TaxID=1223515 RepID=A0A0B5D9P4_9CORY|nr:hypothetical protein B842_05185 [Corynebacterium humireducens NBRC 106098 = DSM 45392]